MGQSHAFLVREGLPAAASFSERDLPAEVARHLRVLRLREGESALFLDGQGKVLRALCRNGKTLEFERAELRAAPPLLPRIELRLSPPRGDALKEAVTQATEIGVGRIRFLRTEHSQWLANQEAPSEKMQRVSDAASEQCLRAWTCEVEAGWHSLSECLREPGVHVVADEIEATRDHESIGFPRSLPDFSRLNEAPIFLYVGPEGGWSENERRLFDGKAAVLSLGSLVLRVPTAIVAASHFLRTVYWHAGSR